MTEIRHFVKIESVELDAIMLLREWVAGCGDEAFSTKEQCRDLRERSAAFLEQFPYKPKK